MIPLKYGFFVIFDTKDNGFSVIDLPPPRRGCNFEDGGLIIQEKVLISTTSSTDKDDDGNNFVDLK